MTPARLRRPAPRDLACVTLQLGRAPHPLRRIAARCPWGAPAVVEDLPYDDAGRPFPTLFWATCPALVAAVAALESAGGVTPLSPRSPPPTNRCDRSLGEATRFERARRRRLAALCPAPRRDGGASLASGVGGVRRPEALKCLHPHAAHALARPGYLLGERILAAAAPVFGTYACCTPQCGSVLRSAFRLAFRPVLRRVFGPAPAPEMAAVKVAVVDMGTNSVRLLLATVEEGRVSDVERLTTVTRLGAGVDRRRRLDGDAAARTRACLAGYAARIAAFAPDAGLLVATSVLRDAHDGPEFLATAAAELDVPARVLSGEEEAALSFAGALSGCEATGEERGGAGGPPGVAAAPNTQPATVVIDIGGGSLELSIGARRPAEPTKPARPTEPATPSFVCSLDVGVVRLTERFFASDPPDDDQWRAARDFVRAALAEALPGALRSSAGEGIGLAGTFTTLVAHKLALRTYDRAAVHGHVLTSTDIAAAQATFRGMPSTARGLLPGIQPGREDVILAGTLLADEVCRAFGLDAVRVSESDLLDGVALSLAAS